MADGPLTVSGMIQSMQPQVQAQATLIQTHAQPIAFGEGPNIFMSGSDIVVPQGGAVEFDGNAHVAPRSADGGITIAGAFSNLNGRGGTDGSPAANGEDGGDIQLGTDRAIQAFMQVGARAVRPRTVRVSGTLRAGDGGRGGNDRSGQGTDPRTFRSGNGGNGGDVFIAASELIDLTGAGESAGFGGFGGSCGPYRGTNGSAPGQSGQSIQATSGNGGNGGSTTVQAPTIVGGSFAQGGSRQTWRRHRAQRRQWRTGRSGRQHHCRSREKRKRWDQSNRCCACGYHYCSGGW